MIADASAIVDLLLDPRSAAGRVLLEQPDLHAPDLVGLETLHTLRGLVRGRRVSSERAHQAVRDFGELRLVRHRHATLEARVWTLRDTLSAYDASYVALAETLDAPLVTADRRLARAAERLVEVVVPTG